MLIIIATILSFIGLFLMQNNGVLTRHKTKQFAAGVVLVCSGVVFVIEYGALRGVFILIGIVSLLGTLFTLLRYKLDKA